MVTICDICRQTPCDFRCPNAPEPPAMFVCSECNGTIREGDDYLEHLGEQICEECVKWLWRVAEYDPD